jgi:formylglycine-generating enzyme required for sulfatase activity
MKHGLFVLIGCLLFSSAAALTPDEERKQVKEQQARERKAAENARAERMRRQREEDDRQAELARRQQIERDRIAREQAAEAARQRAARERAALGIDMLRIPSGNYTMGCQSGRDSSCDGDESPAHTVSLSSFELGKTEVTQGQWKAVMGSNPSYFKDCGDTCPVEQVSWDDVQTFIQKLNAQTGKNYRLPSEAEWEYAARAGSNTTYPWGNQASHEYANYGKDECCEGLAQGRDKWVNTAPVGSFPANDFGLYDMSGNVWEWVQDSYHSDYKGAPSNGDAWEGARADARVLRGGSWISNPRNVRAAYRSNRTAAYRDVNVGFRLARTLP